MRTIERYLEEKGENTLQRARRGRKFDQLAS